MSLNLGWRKEPDNSQSESISNDNHCLDHELLKNLADLIEKITTTGRPSLDEGLMKQIKKICKTSDDYVEHTFHLLLTQLHMGHCEIRLSAFQVCNELFNRSHHFRELLLTDMQVFLEMCVETDPDLPLPPPKAAAKILKESALKAIQQWQNKFGKAYKKLTLGYNFLKFQKKINFDNIEARSAVERRRAVQRQSRKQLAEQQKVIKIVQKMQEKMPEIELSLTQMENCFELLLPRLAECDSPQQKDGESDEQEDDDLIMLDDEHSTSSKSNNTLSTSTAATNDSSSGICVNAENNGDRTIGTKEKGEDIAMEIKQEVATHQLENIELNRETINNEPVVIKQEVEMTEVVKDNDTDVENVAASPKGNDKVRHGAIIKEEITMQDGTQDSAMETDGIGTSSDFSLRQHHGLPSRDYNLTIRINTDGLQLTENEDNADILRTLDDNYTLITSRFLPEIALWMVTLGKTPDQQDRLKRCIDVKRALKGVVEKYRDLRVQHDNPSNQSKIDQDVESSESEEEFEDVPDKEGYEPVIPDHLRAEYGLEPLGSTSTKKPTTSKPKPPTRRKTPVSKKGIRKSIQAGLIPSKERKWHPLMETEHTIDDPTSQAGTIADIIAKTKDIPESQSNSTKEAAQLDPERQKILSQAPVVSFGIDLEHWENPENITAPVVLRPDTDHLVWSSSFHDEEVVYEGVKDSMQTRVMSFAGSFIPVKWKCRAPLPSGKLCDRMDRVKCPFHGKIIGRDKEGQPTNPEDLAKAVNQKAQQEPGSSTSSTFDVELQRDVEAALGMDLGSSTPTLGQKGKGKGKGRGGKKGKGKAKKYPNLTDIKKSKNTARLRLEKKVLNQNAISRVVHAMNAIDKKRLHDKFSNNFNYAYSN